MYDYTAIKLTSYRLVACLPKNSLIFSVCFSLPPTTYMFMGLCLKYIINFLIFSST